MSQPRPWDGRTKAVVHSEMRRAAGGDGKQRLYLTLECGHVVLNPHGRHFYGDALCWDCPETRGSK